MASFTPVGVEATVKGLSGFTRDLGKMDRAIDNTGRTAGGVGSKFKALGGAVVNVGKIMATAAVAGVAALGAGLATIGVKSLQAAISFESAFAGIEKTVDGLDDVIAGTGETWREFLVEGIRELAKEIPATVEDLSAIGEIGGQLGIGKEALLDFTETIVALRESTNLTQEEAATALARISNIYAVSSEDMGENIGRLGSSIVDLGNNFATTESEIANFALRIAGAGNIAGLTQDEILAIGAAMSATGTQAEAGGTAVQKVLLAMNDAVYGTTEGFIDNTEAIADNEQKMLDLSAKLVTLEAQAGITGDEIWGLYEQFIAAGGSAEEFGRQLGDTQRAQLFKTMRSMQDLRAETELLMAQHGQEVGSEMLEGFARVSGLTADEFQKLWGEDSSEAFRLFVEGLAAEGDNAANVLEELGIADQRLVRAFLSLANAGDLLNDALATSSSAWEENTALNIEAEKRYATTAAQLQILKNQVRDIGLTIGAALLPFLTEMIAKAKPLIEEFGQRVPQAIQFVIDKIKELIAAFGAGGPGAVAEAMGLSPSVVAIVEGAAAAIGEAIRFVMDHWQQFKSALIAIGAVMGVVATIGAIASTIALLTNPITLVIAAVAALAVAWDTNFLGIRDTLTAFWENTARPALTQLWTWLKVNIPVAIQALAEFWTNTLQPALEAVWGFITTSVFPMLSNLWVWLKDNIPLAIQTLSEFWQTTLLPALTAVWGFINESVIPLLSTLWTWLSENIPVALQTLSDFWQTILLPALTTVWAFINENVIPILSQIWTWLSVNIPPAIQTLADFWQTVLLPAITEIYNFINDYLVPLFDAVAELLEVTLLLAIEKIAEAWQTVLLPAFQAVGTFVEEKIIPIFDKIVEAAAPVVEFIGELIDKFNLLQGLDLGKITPDINLKEGWEGAKEAVSDLTGNVEGLTGVLQNLRPAPQFDPGSPTPFEIALLGIANAFSVTLPESMLLFSEQAIALLTPVHLLIVQIDTILVKIYSVTLVELGNVTRATTAIMIASFQAVIPVLQEVNALIEQMSSLLDKAGEAAERAAKAMGDGFEKAAKVIKDDLVEAFEKLLKILENVRAEAEAAASAVNDIGNAQPSGPGGAGVGAQHGADFIVPPGFPRDSFPMRVSSGERVIVIPQQQVSAGAGPSVTNHFNLAVHTAASTSSVIQDFGIMRALVG